MDQREFGTIMFGYWRITGWERKDQLQGLTQESTPTKEMEGEQWTLMWTKELCSQEGQDRREDVVLTAAKE